MPETISLDPIPGKLIHALRAIGYSFPQAVADLVDNSINAKASGVAIRAVMGAKAVARVLIVDNGRGMSKPDLDEAMRLGSDNRRDVDSLGKYGMGLKLASLSQAQRLTVITRSQPYCGGRRWTIEGIAQGWKCEVLPDKEVLEELDNPFDTLDLSRSGTIVIWEELDKIKSSKNGVEATVGLLFGHVRQHLGLHFHRFLEDGRLQIYLERVEERRPTAIGVEPVSPLNPFSYQVSGDDDYPREFKMGLVDHKALVLDAHIWPASSKSANYKLGGKAAARQGFYFYRHDRLIQAGGWNETRQTEAEPHLSLARVRIDLPKELDDTFGLSVQKSSIQVPPTFSIGLSRAAAANGTKFNEYQKAAQVAYRKGERRNSDNFPLVPEGGINKALRKRLRDLLAAGGGRVRRVDFEWEALPPSEVVRLDRERPRVLLNKHYRRDILGGSSASSGDAPLFKTLVFLLARESLDSGRISAQQREQLELLNKMLLAAMQAL